MSYKKRAVIVGPYRKHNFGDDLVGGIIAKHLQRSGHDVSIPLLGKENAKWLGIDHADRYGRLIEQADTVVVGGGGILSDTSGPNPGMSFLEPIARSALNGKLAEKKTFVTSVGAGPWILESSKFMTLIVTMMADKIGVRDDESYKHLRSLGVNTSKVVQGADLALLTSDYLEFEPVLQDKIGLQFDIWSFRDVLNNPEADNIRETVRSYAASNSANVALVGNTARNSQIHGPGTEDCELLNYEHLQRFLPRLAGLKAMFTSHLHLAIVAHSQRIPCFSLYVREKTKRFYDQIGHPERAIDLSTATVSDFKKLIEMAEEAEWTEQDEATLLSLQKQSRTLLEFVK
ncbi:polysaccharide pyruvyl transferase family protein [Nesterenkonia ebinurensis]|uniref:polysaccharide pyruvyl transferase family protein n=1 Tax=Nesterenkonia ebinurensis TaxID=2608252 RepID=UPI00123DE638|nr:polysaccharide pyruvyl transferase family protein [Nesterenkonia ebinurensis]